MLELEPAGVAELVDAVDSKIPALQNPLVQYIVTNKTNASMVELVDTTDSKSVAAMCAGSSPATGTICLVDF